MKRSYLLILPLVALPLFAAKPNSCSLDRSILSVYANPTASIDAFGATRLTLYNFTGCDPALVDPASRHLFFEVVQREFEYDFAPQFAAWAKESPGSEALEDGLRLHQADLRRYMDALFDAKVDRKYSHVVVQYGLGKTIARLGPEAKNDVKRVLELPKQAYGIAQHNPQVEALAALGYWIDPANTSFTPVEKSEFVNILTGVLAVVERVPPGDIHRIVHSTLSALSRSDDAWAENAIRKWMGKQDERSELYRKAASSADEIQKKIKARKQKT